MIAASNSSQREQVGAQPLLEITRGQLVESLHAGSIAVVDSSGKLLASYGDPASVAFLRSSAKPFQALPFVEGGGMERYDFTERELAISCASHLGGDMHVQTVEAMQKKIGIDESYLQCGVHLPDDIPAFKRLIVQGESPTPNRNNCSGKHTMMLACAKMRGVSLENYLAPDHPVQRDILAALSDLCLMPPQEISVGIDGCSAPNFAMPLFNAALGVARLCDPRELNETRATACRKIVSAMTSHPEMVSGPGEFDCELMKIGRGKIICKRGAEGFQIIGLAPGALEGNSLGIGVAFKALDGDASRIGANLEAYSRVRPPVTLEILRQLGVLSIEQQQTLSAFGPVRALRNLRGLTVGQLRPAFTLRA